MADMKIPPQSLPAVRPASPARAEAVRAAQRAFFDAAMTQAQTPPSKAAPAGPQATAAPAPTQAAGTDVTQRYLRPGSRVDIKV